MGEEARACLVLPDIRWARRRSAKSRLYCKALGVEYLTIYAFSTENWKRPADEVSTLMSLLKKYMQEAS